MKKLSFVLMAAFISVAAIAQNDPKPAEKGVTYGAGTVNKDVVTIGNMEEQVQSAGKFSGKITGKVTEVCQEKGCWMKVDKGNGETIMVKFKDYAFFMPKNLAGQTVVLEGEATVKEVSVKQQKHYAEDAGKSKDEINKIKEAKKEVQFVAKGVLVL
jgi:Domain of unknown function (DUF4920)